jgi:hypothetical protein
MQRLGEMGAVATVLLASCHCVVNPLLVPFFTHWSGGHAVIIRDSEVGRTAARSQTRDEAPSDSLPDPHCDSRCGRVVLLQCICWQLVTRRRHRKRVRCSGLMSVKDRKSTLTIERPDKPAEMRLHSDVDQPLQLSCHGRCTDN